ncbi:MAG: ATP-binding protein [Verrucomicrobiae bacterium]|nr:ATP-binding protein [Verrucomicrobiae bacterium]
MPNSDSTPSPAKKKRPRAAKNRAKGKLRIGDTWSAITIIALSQNNPLKAIAEFVENSIDAKAKHISIVRGKERGESFLRITDDGEGIPCNDEGEPDFQYVATHICDSIKRRVKAQGGGEGIQGEFGIGLLSFWTVGEELFLTSAGTNERTYQMRMAKGEQGYEVTPRRTLFSMRETELLIKPLLPGIRQLTAEKIQWYLASELRDRIRTTGVQIKVIDRTARKEYEVKPIAYSGTHLPLDPITTPMGDIRLELYLASHDPENCISLSRLGTRVIGDITRLGDFQREPWNVRSLEGVIDAQFLRLTPGTRDGVIHDDAYDTFIRQLRKVEPVLNEHIQQLKDAEEQKASHHVLKSVQRALREAFLALPKEEYDWFDLHKRARGMARKPSDTTNSDQQGADSESETALSEDSPTDGAPAEKAPASAQQQEFFEYEGSLYSVTIAPASCALKAGDSRTFRAVTRDKSRRFVERDLKLKWEILDGEGELSSTDSEIVTFTAPQECGLVRLRVAAVQHDVECEAEALVTITDTLLPEVKRNGNDAPSRGLPGYTFEHAPADLWRSRYDESQNLIVVNSGHRDFVYASSLKARRLRYICRLFTKELVIKNFPGIPTDQLLERMVELALYTEDHLR